MERDVLTVMIAKGLSIRAMAEDLGVTPGTVQRWLLSHGLRTHRAEQLHARRHTERTAGSTALLLCRVHGRTEFVGRQDGGGWRCLKCRSQAVVTRRRKVKAILVAEAGGACCLCGYSRYTGALEFHHRDPALKRFSLSQAGVTRSLERCREEAAKCVLVCANCHAEIEAGLASIP